METAGWQPEGRYSAILLRRGAPFGWRIEVARLDNDSGSKLCDGLQRLHFLLRKIDLFRDPYPAWFRSQRAQINEIRYPSAPAKREMQLTVGASTSTMVFPGFQLVHGLLWIAEPEIEWPATLNALPVAALCQRFPEALQHDTGFIVPQPIKNNPAMNQAVIQPNIHRCACAQLALSGFRP